MTRARRLLRFGVLAVLVVTLGVFAGGCRKVISDVLLESLVSDYYYDISTVRVDVRCPEGKTLRTDNDFFCHIYRDGKRTGQVLVLPQDDYGRMIVSIETPLDMEIVLPFLKDWLRRDQPQLVGKRITCPEDIIREPDRNFACRVGSRRVEVRQVDGVSTFVFNLLAKGQKVQ
ncbi:MAG: hypothetical protein JWN72_49 [Thermoleophilia bacterium]|nr:hypothetical protein [Thermoleophilia bacterium]